MSDSEYCVVDQLIRRGVTILLPDSVEIAEDVNPDLIAPGVTLHPGCRIRGRFTAIDTGAVLGEEQPVTLQDCQLGRGVRLKGGFLTGSTFLEGASMGSGAHVRPGTLLEEEARGAHTVGLKQTILFPFVTLGSLINFCDCLMAGGTSQKNHSEVGSSYVHFNFSPRQDKATASLIGDVPKGVMLDQRPIFLGGQGGIVGPVRIGYGNVIPAGVICRSNALEPDRIVCGDAMSGRGALPYDLDVYKDVTRIVRNNLIYIGNLQALQTWYDQARQIYVADDPIGKACFGGARQKLSECMDERIMRLDQLAGKVERSIERLLGQTSDKEAPGLASQQAFAAAWPELREQLGEPVPVDLGGPSRDFLMQALEQVGSESYWPNRVAALPDKAREAGIDWLQAIVDKAGSLWHFEDKNVKERS